MKISISADLEKILGYARDEAMRTGCWAISVDHLMLGLLRDSDNSVVESLRRCGLDPEEMKKRIDEKVFNPQSIPFCDLDKIVVSQTASGIVNLAAMEALRCGRQMIEPSHLLLAIAKSESGESYALLHNYSEAISKDLHLDNATNVTPSPFDFTHIIRINPDTEIYS